MVAQTMERNRKIHFQFIERKSPKIISAIAESPIYKKQGLVRARPASPGEEIVTVMESGHKETSNHAKEGDWVVTNPSGEQYLISDIKFSNRYEPTEKDGVYEAKGYCRAMKNPYGFPIEIMASWGTPQTGDEHCLLADTCDKDGLNLGGEPYIIESEAFEKTYKLV